jgi:hypothetical protein
MPNNAIRNTNGSLQKNNYSILVKLAANGGATGWYPSEESALEKPSARQN